TGYEAADGFVVLAGGMAREQETTNCPRYICTIRQSLVDSGVFSVDGDRYHLTQDYSFNSPSQAASVMMARSANGRIEWKDESGRTLKEIQEAVVNDE
ncbi:MAG: DUF4357 domain-containing protein, partial [Fuerstiella sp.]|nr:DUF4357 domain-containing protein [Fuerstiella sp.]